MNYERPEWEMKTTYMAEKLNKLPKILDVAGRS